MHTHPSDFNPLADVDSQPLVLPKPVGVVAINLSGNSGKTTLYRHLLKPIMPRAQCFRIASGVPNVRDAAQKVLRPKQLEEAAIALCGAHEHVIVDIDAADTRATLRELREIDASHRWIDLWVVPCIRQPSVHAKMYADTLATVYELVRLGVDPARIAVIKNKVSDVATMNADFEPVIAAAQALGFRVIQTPVLDLDLYCELDDNDDALEAIASDPTDYRARMREAQSSGSRVRAEAAVLSARRRRYAGTALSNLARVRAELFGG